MNSKLKIDLSKCLKGEEKGEAARRAFYDNHIAPLRNPQGAIDWKSGAAKEVAAIVRATVQTWYIGAARVVDGHVIQPADLKAALAPTAKGHKVRAGAMAGITVKAWRWTGRLVAEFNPTKSDESKAPSGTVAVAVARSKARKGKNKAAKAATVEAPASVPMLSEALRDAIAKLKPQSRIAAANQVMDYMRNIVSEARAAMDTAPRKPAKVSKAAKATAPAPVAVQ
jgi:hypothetical protein